MDRDKMMKILEAFRRPVVLDTTGKPAFYFLKQTLQDAEEIERTPTAQLVESWKGLAWVNHIHRQVSLNDLQRMALIELEFDSRDAKEIDGYQLESWYVQTKADYDRTDPEAVHEDGDTNG